MKIEVAKWKRVGLAAGLMLGLSIAGCDSESVPDEAASFLREIPRSSPVSIADVVSAQSEQDQGTDAQTQSVEGVIYAGDLEPFQPGVATFILSELPDPEHGDGTLEHLSECAFCRRNSASQTKALVEFRDERGKLIKKTASDLLNLAVGDRVIVTGECRFDEVANMLTINAANLEKPSPEDG